MQLRLPHLTIMEDVSDAAIEADPVRHCFPLEKGGI